MSVVAPVRVHLPSWSSMLSFTHAHKISLLVVGGGALLLSLAGRLLRRRRAAPGRLQAAVSSLRYLRPQSRPARTAAVGGGDVGDSAVSPSGSLRRRRRTSALSSASVSSLQSAVPARPVGGPLQPQQLGMMGMEALEAAAGYWEDALAAYRGDVAAGAAVPSREEAEFCRQLQRLLDSAGRLQAECEQMFLFYESALYRSTSVTPAPTVVSNRGRTRTATSDCSLDSFHSAAGAVADLSDFDETSELADAAGDLPLYRAALGLYDTDGIPFRALRTSRVGCGSDVEYLARLHCVRLGYQYMLQDSGTRAWMVDTGRQLLTQLMLRADRHPKDMVAAYDAMVAYLAQPEVWPTVKVELQARNVRCFTFFDIVLDYIILDAFDDLESPPSTVLAVMHNRWLTAGFKESALNTAIWSVLKAKRQSMQFANGFKSHFYTLAEHLIPVLAWGLLGPDKQFGDVCRHLKDQVSGYVRDIFDVERVRYTTVEELTDDLVRLTRERFQLVCQRLQEEEE